VMNTEDLSISYLAWFWSRIWIRIQNNLESRVRTRTKSFRIRNTAYMHSSECVFTHFSQFCTRHFYSLFHSLLSGGGGMATHRPAILYHLIEFCVSFNAVPKQLTLIMRHYIICTLQYIRQQHISDNIC
jgi:hypothetical protein